MVLKSGVYPSLHQNCHHQIIFAEFKVYYPPPYERTIYTAPKQMLTIFNKQLIFLIGRTLSVMLILMLKCPFFPTLS